MRRAYRVLACTTAEAERRLRLALEGDELVMALTYPEALAALRPGHTFDAVIIGMLFHESRALELMQKLAASAEGRVPIIGLRGAKHRRFVHPEVFDLPMMALGAADVIDVGSIPDDEEGHAEIGRRIRACISGARE